MPKRRPDHVPMRTCAVCREVKPKRSMTRVVRAADGSVSIDPTGKAAGRGTYVCDDSACREPGRLAEGIGRALGAATDMAALTLEVTDASA
jgi:predicted RNA-binding protein YlxR (DUF448 family)